MRGDLLDRKDLESTLTLIYISIRGAWRLHCSRRSLSRECSSVRRSAQRRRRDDPRLPELFARGAHGASCRSATVEAPGVLHACGSTCATAPAVASQAQLAGAALEVPPRDRRRAASLRTKPRRESQNDSRRT
jgi:hypothetical protein